MQISELFHSLQGEGRLTGTPMYFIRAQGCAVKCPIRDVCDQPESLGFKGGERHEPASLADKALAAVGAGGWVCLTGGEPTEQADFAAVVDACRARGLRVNVQTSGLHAVPAMVDWCTVSPKAPLPRLVVRKADELKIVYTGQTPETLLALYREISARHYFLQPWWRDGGCNADETVAAVLALNRLGAAFEFTAQWHKYLGAH